MHTDIVPDAVGPRGFRAVDVMQQQAAPGIVLRCVVSQDFKRGVLLAQLAPAPKPAVRTPPAHRVHEMLKAPLILTCRALRASCLGVVAVLLAAGFVASSSMIIAKAQRLDLLEGSVVEEGVLMRTTCIVGIAHIVHPDLQ